MQFKKLLASAVAPTAFAQLLPLANSTETKLSNPIIYEDDVVAIPEDLVCVPGPGGPCEISAQSLVSESTTGLVRGLLKTAVPATISHVADRALASIAELVESELLGLLESSEGDTYLKRIALKGHNLAEDFEAVIGYHVNQAREKHFILMLRGLGADEDRVILFLPEDESFLGEEDEETSIYEEAKEALKDLGYRALVRKLNFVNEIIFQLGDIQEAQSPTKYTLRSVQVTEEISAYFNAAQIHTYPEGIARPTYVKRIETFAKMFKAYFCLCSQKAEDRTVEIQTADVGLDDITVEQGQELITDIASVLASF